MKPRHAMLAHLLTVDEVADYLRVSRGSIYRLLKRNQLPAFKIGNDWRFDVEQIDRWCDEREIRTPHHSTY